MGNGLSSDQIFLISLIAGGVASILAQIIKWMFAKKGVVLGRRPVTVLLFAISLGLGVWWLAPQIPPFPLLIEDTAAYVGLIFVWLAQILTLLTTLVGFATVIYNLMLQKVLEKISVLLNPPPPPLPVETFENKYLE
jgi:hypothetical protein